MESKWIVVHYHTIVGLDKTNVSEMGSSRYSRSFCLAENMAEFWDAAHRGFAEFGRRAIATDKR